MRFRTRVRTLALAGAALLLGGCATNPVTGERQLTLISEAQEIELGRSSAEEVAATLGLVQDDELQAYVNRVGQALAKASERPGLPWAFAVVDDPTPNAFALPGGFIFITRGMAALMNSEAELASVLGHEIGHVTARHSVGMITRQQLAQLGLGLGAVLVPEIQPFGQAIGAGVGLLFLRHSRDAERQADELGFRYTLEHGYAVSEMADVFTALQRVGEREREGSALPAWLTTHPAPADRIAAVEARIAELDRPSRGERVGEAEYLQQIDGLVYGDDPRQGFFREDEFIHPALQFRLDFPDNWARENLTRAVVGTSPNRDAALQLSIPGSLRAEEAARQFASQPGISLVGTGEDRVNGVPALLARFEAATEQGAILGIAAWLSHGGRTYQLIGYAPAGAYRRHEDLFERVIGSFAPLRDRALLNVEPRRVDVVRLDESMTLAVFHRRMSSSIEIEELAVLNEVEGPRAVLLAGTYVKRVV
jgi:predicted Zn-dependent protease